MLKKKTDLSINRCPPVADGLVGLNRKLVLSYLFFFFFLFSAGGSFADNDRIEPSGCMPTEPDVSRKLAPRARDRRTTRCAYETHLQFCVLDLHAARRSIRIGHVETGLKRKNRIKCKNVPICSVRVCARIIHMCPSARLRTRTFACLIIA